MEDRLITLKEYSKILGGVSRSTMYRRLRDAPHTLAPPLKIGERVYFRLSSVMAALDRLEGRAGA